MEKLKQEVIQKDEMLKEHDKRYLDYYSNNTEIEQLTYVLCI